MDTFDAELAEAYAALQAHYDDPRQHRNTLIRRYLPFAGVAVLGLLLIGWIVVMTMGARNAAVVSVAATSDGANGNATMIASEGPAQRVASAGPSVETPPGDQAEGSPSPLAMAAGANQAERSSMVPPAQGPPGLAAAGPLSVEQGAGDIALRYALVWANQGGGIDPESRRAQMAALRGVGIEQIPDTTQGPGIQVVVSSHLVKVTLEKNHVLVDLALLLAGASMSQWMTVQIPVRSVGDQGWVVLGDPVWLSTPPAPPAPPQDSQAQWLTGAEHPHQAIFTAFFEAFASQPVVNDPTVVSTPIPGLNGAMHFDAIEAIGTSPEHPGTLVKVRWLNDTGLAMTQVYLLSHHTDGVITQIRAAPLP